MLNFIPRFSFLILIILFSHSRNPAQTIGELFTTEKAEELFGEVLKSVDIETSVLKRLVDKTESVLMFSIIDDQLVIAGDNRKVLYPGNYQLEADDVLHVWTIDIILELLDKGKQDIVTIERRQDVLSITNGQQTLEMSQWCPPFCRNQISVR